MLAEETDLVCTRCRNKARKGSVLYLIADAKAVHVAIKQAPRGELPQVCGGVVVPPGQEWLAHVVPGGLARAQRPGDAAVHRVRLGRRVAPGAWEGTALCGATGGAWDPSAEAAPHGERPACEACRI